LPFEVFYIVYLVSPWFSSPKDKLKVLCAEIKELNNALSKLYTPFVQNYLNVLTITQILRKQWILFYAWNYKYFQNTPQNFSTKFQNKRALQTKDTCEWLKGRACSKLTFVSDFFCWSTRCLWSIYHELSWSFCEGI
jgi:hypothetical protein